MSLEHAAATRVEVRPDSEASGIAIHMVRTPLIFVRGVVHRSAEKREYHGAVWRQLTDSTSLG